MAPTPEQAKDGLLRFLEVMKKGELGPPSEMLALLERDTLAHMRILDSEPRLFPTTVNGFTLPFLAEVNYYSDEVKEPREMSTETFNKTIRLSARKQFHHAMVTIFGTEGDSMQLIIATHGPEEFDHPGISETRERWLYA